VTIGRRVYSNLGDIADVRIADVNAISEVVKYPAKTPGTNNAAAEWFAGEPLLTDDGAPGLIHPHLAARWEIATSGERIGDRYGSFRAVPPPENEKITERSGRPAHVCTHCGSDHWRKVVWPIPDWVRISRLAGVEPFGRPRPMNKGDPHEREREDGREDDGRRDDGDRRGCRAGAEAQAW
jgi:hypothetical protein